MGGGWRPRVITGRTDDRGCWHLQHLSEWLHPLLQARSGKRAPRSSGPTAVTDEEPAPATDEDLATPALDYETRYRKAVADRLDYMQLFGIDVPREAKEYSLSVAYVSLQLADDEATEDREAANDEPGDSVPTILSAEEVFDSLRPGAGRLWIRGVAGCGKTTLLRWAAVQVGKSDVKAVTRANAEAWRHRIPFIIRLRDYPDGHLPRPSAFPLLPRDGSRFATTLVRALREQTPLAAPPPGRSQEARARAATIRARQFFFFRCFTNAYQLDDPDLSVAYKEIAQHLLPPRNLTDAEALAACGEAVVPHLAYWAGLRVHERAACARALVLIGGTRARTLLEAYLQETSGQVVRDLISLYDDALTIPYVQQYIQQYGSVPEWARKKVQDVAPLAALTNLTSLDFERTRPTGIETFKAAVPNCGVFGP